MCYGCVWKSTENEDGMQIWLKYKPYYEIFPGETCGFFPGAVCHVIQLRSM